MPHNDFVILGFPKCGTTGLTRNLNECDDIGILRGDELNWECPIYHGGCDFEPIKADRVGHKYTYYAHNLPAMKAIQLDSPNAVGILCLRSLSEILLSWHGMHRRFAIEGYAGHFTNENEETRRFYAECDVEEYFVREQGRFNFAQSLQRVRDAEFHSLLVTDQRQIEERGGEVIDRIRRLLSLPPNHTSNETLRPPPRRAKDTGDLPAWIKERLLLEKRRMIPIIWRWWLEGKTYLSRDFGFLEAAKVMIQKPRL